MKHTSRMLLAALAFAAPAAAQSNISPTAKYSWSENCGWMNWRDAGSPAGSQGVVVAATYLSGYIWAENIGWINVGDGSPGSGTVYSNLNGTDFGVNIDVQTGNLSGYAWGENVGWINFAGGSIAAGAAGAARITLLEPRRMMGYAWGENIGWINLDDAAKFVGLGCYANCDSSTAAPVLNVNDFVCFLNRFSAGDPYANCDGSTAAPTLNVNDFTCFLNKFAVGCP